MVNPMDSNTATLGIAGTLLMVVIFFMAPIQGLFVFGLALWMILRFYLTLSEDRPSDSHRNTDCQ